MRSQLILFCAVIGALFAAHASEAAAGTYIHLTSPVSGGVYNARPAISYTLDPGVAITGPITCDFDGPEAATGPPAYTCLVDPHPTLPLDGVYTFTISANLQTSPGGAPIGTDSDTVSFTLDTVAPVVTIISPTPGQMIDNSTPDVNLAVSGGVAECSFDGAPFVACNAQFVASPLADGAHRLCVRAVDAAGNAAQVCVDFITDDLLPAPGAEGPPPAAHRLYARRGGKVKRGRFSVPVSLRLTPSSGTSVSVACRGTVTFRLKPRVRGAITVTRRARLRVSGSQCVSRTRISLPSAYKSRKATVRARFGGSDALGSFSYAKTIKRL